MDSFIVLNTFYDYKSKIIKTFRSEFNDARLKALCKELNVDYSEENDISDEEILNLFDTIEKRIHQENTYKKKIIEIFRSEFNDIQLKALCKRYNIDCSVKNKISDEEILNLFDAIQKDDIKYTSIKNV